MEPLQRAELERLLTLDEVADYLAVPKATIYRWRVDGNGPRGFKVGKHLRFRRSVVENWLEAQSDDGVDDTDHLKDQTV